MRLKDFKEIVKDIQEGHKIMDELSEYLKPELFTYHNRLISNLLVQLYGETVVTYIFDEWLRGNRSPIIFTQNDGTTIEQPIESVHDLWKVMERMKHPGEILEKGSTKDVDWDMLNSIVPNMDSYKNITVLNSSKIVDK